MARSFTRSFGESETQAKKQKFVHGVASYSNVDYLYCPMIVSDLRSCIDIDIRLYGNQKEIIRFFPFVQLLNCVEYIFLIERHFECERCVSSAWTRAFFGKTEEKKCSFDPGERA